MKDHGRNEEELQENVPLKDDDSKMKEESSTPASHIPIQKSQYITTTPVVAEQPQSVAKGDMTKRELDSILVEAFYRYIHIHVLAQIYHYHL